MVRTEPAPTVCGPASDRAATVIERVMRAVSARQGVMPDGPGGWLGMDWDTPLGGWLRGLLARHDKNIVVVALANKLARIGWTVLSGDRNFAEAVTA